MAAVPEDAELLRALRALLAERGVASPRTLRCRPSEYRTSFPLE